MAGWDEQEWGSSLFTGSPWGGGTFAWSPVDISYLSASLDPVLERASFASDISPVASYTVVAANCYHVPTLTASSSNTPSISKAAEYRPSYAKVGTP